MTWSGRGWHGEWGIVAVRSTPPSFFPMLTGDMSTLSRSENIVVALSGFGAVLMGYLTYLHFKTTPGAFCNFGAGFSCDLVNKSVWSEVAGVPVSVMGLAYFLGAAFLVLRKPVADAMRAIQLFTAFSLAFSLYLTRVEIFVLGSICLFCELSKLTMIAVFVAASRARAEAKLPFGAAGIALAFGAGAVFTLAVGLLRGA